MNNNSRSTPEQMIAGAVRETVRLATMIKFYDPEFDPSKATHWVPYVDLYEYYNRHNGSPTNQGRFTFQINVFEQFFAFFHSPVSPIERATRRSVTAEGAVSHSDTARYQLKRHVLEWIVGTNLLRGIHLSASIPPDEWMAYFYRIRNKITNDNS